MSADITQIGKTGLWNIMIKYFEHPLVKLTGRFILFFHERFSTLLYLPPVRFYCSEDAGIEPIQNVGQSNRMNAANLWRKKHCRFLSIVESLRKTLIQTSRTHTGYNLASKGKSC
jgi:hypothetical protein